ncbi:PotD/PotF family extracellular solute-binding protein [Leptolyngbya sp. PCC 6406]|uniref:ABC transporter substrate-binding protein n=1 Tax=Leptolyngbya sp. PCC 6406 TaxID=1173264 RepID=UPI001CED51A7|nr:extracellular solute-binding protein [Leptolyngbya sp. PCC 6406]
MSSSSHHFGSTRRRFLQGSAAALAGVTLSNCRRNLTSGPGAEESTSATTGGSDGPLRIYTWADYTSDELAAQFTERTGIEVVIDIYDSNETMLAKMQAGGGDGYSIIYPSDYMVQQMLELEMLTELDQDRLQGLENMLNQWQDPVYDSGNAHSVPFSWGTTGLLYNTEVVSGTPEDWDYLWENQSSLARQITLLDDVRETMGATLKSLGYSYNSTDPAEIEEAYERLVEIKPALASFMSFGYEDALFGGDLTVVMAYSVDAISATIEDDRMEYIVPASGSSVWTDTMVIPTSAPNVDAAYEWMNFMLEPEVSTSAVESLFFATPNAVSLDLLSDEVRNNEDLFPSDEVLARCEGIAPIGDATDLYDEYWTRLTSA